MGSTLDQLKIKLGPTKHILEYKYPELLYCIYVCQSFYIQPKCSENLYTNCIWDFILTHFDTSHPWVG